MARVAVYTLGCKVNQAESDELCQGLAARGHAISRDPAAADLCVVNTCTVTAESDRKCRKLIRKLARSGARAIAAAGCYAQVSPEDLRGLPGVVAVIPNQRKEGWVREVESLLPSAAAEAAGRWPRRTRALVKVQDGCERGCAYCIVPRARGAERSRAFPEVMLRVSDSLEAGTGEIVLCGVNLGRYGDGARGDLAALVREVLTAGDAYRVRLSSIELEDLRVEWMEEWSRNPRVCPHLHLPLQSGDDAVLADMGRGYGAGDYLDAVATMRSLWPGAALTTEVMVGYPGEDERSFRNTLQVLAQARPSRVHVFRFSPRPGTAAWGRADAVPVQEAEERSARLRELAEAWRLRYIGEHGGERRDLLVERLVEEAGVRTAYGTTGDFIKGAVRGLRAGVGEGDLLAVEIRGHEDGLARLEARGGRKRGAHVGGSRGRSV